MEVAGLAVGVIGLSGLVDSCVNCFQYVQLGKKFGEDRQRARLKLDILELRLSRWATAVKSLPSLSPEEFEQAESLLGGIISTFKAAETLSGEDAETLSESFSKRVSGKYKSKFSRNSDIGAASDEGHLDLDLDELHARMRQMALTEQKRSSMKIKVSWAIHEQKRLDSLLQDLTLLIDGLIELFPTARQEQEQKAGDQAKQLTEVGGEAIVTLENAAARLDPMLQVSIRKSLENTQKHTYNMNIITGDAIARYGDEVNDDRIPTRTMGNWYSQNQVSGKAIAHYGNSYGGRSIFDLR